MAEASGPSGQGGLLGRVADCWDRVPVTGKVMPVLVAAVGAALALTSGGGAGSCDTSPLRHVYRPSRLEVVEKCAHVTGTVIAWRHEHDGDIHVSMRMDAPGWVNAVNRRKQHGYTVVEFVPLMPRVPLRAGERLELVCTKVLDRQHGGWLEGHPCESVKEVAPGATASQNRRALAPATEGGEP